MNQNLLSIIAFVDIRYSLRNCSFFKIPLHASSSLKTALKVQVFACSLKNLSFKSYEVNASLGKSSQVILIEVQVSFKWITVYKYVFELFSKTFD